MNTHLELKKVIPKNIYLMKLRKNGVIKTPEEVVRQNFWKYLHHEKKYPKSLIAVEKQILTNGLKEIRYFNIQ